MQDIAPELLKRIQSDFRDKCRSDKELGKLIDKIDSGKGDFRDAQGFAEHIGDRLGEAYVKNLTEETLPNGRLYRNIAEKVITPTLERNHDLVCDASGKVEQALNEEAGIGLKVQVPELDQDRLNGLIDHVSDHEDPFTDEKAQELADLAENFTHHVVDAFIEKNADAHYAAGLSPKIERDAMAECCAWCLDLAGTYDYPLKDRSVYQRHKDCRCVVDYHPGNGKVQNVHSKEWRDETDSDILEARKTANLEPLVDPAKIEQRKQLEKQTGGKITGGHHYIADPVEGEKGLLAAKYYEKYAKVDDAEVISKNTGFSIQDIRIVRSHVFYEKHNLDTGYKRFAPDYDMAVAWKRLQNGDYYSRDITLLNHELLESQIEKEYNLTAREAHDRANKIYNWLKQLWEETDGKGEPDGLF